MPCVVRNLGANLWINLWDSAIATESARAGSSRNEKTAPNRELQHQRDQLAAAVLMRWLAEFQPDIVGLQELKCTDEMFPRAAIEELGYAAIWHGQRSWNGVAILSRVGEPVETRRGLPDDPDPSLSRYIEAAVCGILIGNMYAPNGNPWPGPKFDYKLAWLDELRSMPRTCSTAACRRS